MLLRFNNQDLPMFNKAFYLILILCSVIIYILCLLAIFNIFPLIEDTQHIIVNYDYNHRFKYFIALIIALFMPNLLAVISYWRQRARTPEMKQT